MYIEFHESGKAYEPMVCCMDLSMIPQIGSTITFTKENKVWRRFRVVEVEHDINLISEKSRSYFRTDLIAIKCFVDAVQNQGRRGEH